jgi:hypothetical protein
MIIYLIEDINDLKYVGKTKQTLSKRFAQHLADKYSNGRPASSSKNLHLEHSIIYKLEECEKEFSKGREKYWINKIDCVNEKKLNGRNKEKQKEYYTEYNEKNKEKQKQYRIENKEKRNARVRELYKLKKQQSKLKSKQ